MKTKKVKEEIKVNDLTKVPDSSDEWAVDSALRTIMDAHKFLIDETMMKKVKALAKTKVGALECLAGEDDDEGEIKSVEDLRRIANKKLSGD